MKCIGYLNTLRVCNILLKWTHTLYFLLFRTCQYLNCEMNKVEKFLILVAKVKHNITV